MIVKEKQGQAVEEVPTSRTRRYWLWIVWAVTWWMPSFSLKWLGRMKRPDVQLAWREKVTIFWLIFLLNAVVIFYIVEFGRLLCPNYDKAWTSAEVAQHQGQDDWWVSIHGIVYDLTNFVGGNHARTTGMVSNSPDNLEQLAGQDLSYYFPPPLILACPGLVEDDQMHLTWANFTPAVPLAIHTSGALQSAEGRWQQPDWYSEVFVKSLKEYVKGPLVWTPKEVLAQARDENIKR